MAKARPRDEIAGLVVWAAWQFDPYESNADRLDAIVKTDTGRVRLTVPYSTIGELDTTIAEAPKRLLGRHLSFKGNVETLLSISVVRRVIDCHILR